MPVIRRFISIISLLVLGLLPQLSYSASFIYEIRGNAGGTNNIWRINPVLPAVNVVYTGYPGGNAATLAQCPDGLIYYVINVTNGVLYRWNPATPATAPVAVGAGIGAGIGGSFRFACNSAGTLYYMPDGGNVVYTINKATGVATAGPTITGLGSGGDMAFNAAGVLYVITSGRQLFTASIAGGAGTLVGTVTFPGGITPATLGLAFDTAGNLYTQTQNPTNLYKITGTAATLVTALLGDTTSTGDLASAFLSSPNITVAKAFAPATIVTNGVSTLTVTLSNANAVAMTAAAFTDTYPAAVVTAATPATATTCGGTVSTTAGSVTLSGGTIPANGACTVSVNVTSATAGTYTNTIAAGAVSTAVVYNDNPASAVLNVKLPLSMSKSSVVFSDPVNNITNPKRIPGSFVDYTIVTTNSANGTVDNNQVVVSDPIPTNTELFVGNLGGAGSGPVAFTAGGSGLTYTFTSLASGTDDVLFSNNGGVSFVYTPVANANGVDTTVTHIGINPKGTFSSSSSFQIRFRVRVK
jgi:trimeric autotransporter adhesin